jgi:putative ABC transport system substrate-binding protein
MQRRDFVTLLSTAAVLSEVRAQSAPKIARLGFLGVTFACSWASRLEALQSGLRDFGYLEGKNIHIEFRWAEEQYNRLPALAAELVGLNVDALLTYGTPGTLAAKNIPIVFLYAV